MPLAGHETLVLSDSGSTIAFVVESFMRAIGNTPLGLWIGSLETVNKIEEVQINFYKLRIVIYSSSTGLTEREFLALETPYLGKRAEIPNDLVNDVAKAVGYKATDFFVSAGKVNVLLGQDTHNLLLNKVDTKTTSQAFSCEFYQDLSVQSSPCSNLLSIVGAVGKGQATDG